MAAAGGGTGREPACVHMPACLHEGGTHKYTCNHRLEVDIQSTKGVRVAGH